jgi:hypothetical protein
VLLKTILLSVVLSGLAFAQSAIENYKLTGEIVEFAAGKPLPCANVIVKSKKSSKFLAGAASDENGNFSVINIPEKIVSVKISMIGFSTKIIDSISLNTSENIGTIRLEAESLKMPEVMVKSGKTMIEVKVDRQIINIDQVPGSGGTIENVLKNSGLVEVDAKTKQMTVRGEQVSVQIDGKPSTMPGEMLAKMPAAMLEQAEIILSPSASESAEGGAYIINLISKKSILDNFNGSINLNASSDRNNIGGINMNFKNKRINIFGDLFAEHEIDKSSDLSNKYYYNSVNTFYQRSLEKNKQTIPIGFARLGVDYNLDETNTVTLTGSYEKAKIDSKSSTNSEVENIYYFPQYNYRYVNNSSESSNVFTFCGYYKKKFAETGHELNLDLFYSNMFNPTDDNIYIDYSNMSAVSQLQTSTTDINANTAIGRLNYIRPLGNGNIETGYNFTYRYRNNNYTIFDHLDVQNTWLKNNDYSNNFKYTENINALYFTISQTFGAFELKAGMRTENLSTKGEQVTNNENFSENYLNFFPNLNAAYKFGDGYKIIFNAFRRVIYPQVYYLNPFIAYDSPNNYNIGNPKIKPNFLSSYSLALSQYINLYYVKSSGLVTPVTGTVNDSITVTSYMNLNSNETYGLELTLPYYNSSSMLFQLPDFVSMLDIRYGYKYRKQDGKYLKENLTYTDKTYWVRCNLGIDMWYDVSAFASFSYTPSVNNARKKLSSYKDLSISLEKNFFDRKLDVEISIHDILKSWPRTAQTFGSDFTFQETKSWENSRSISLSLTYMFNDYKARSDKNISDGRDDNNKTTR